MIPFEHAAVEEDYASRREAFLAAQDVRRGKWLACLSLVWLVRLAHIGSEGLQGRTAPLLLWEAATAAFCMLPLAQSRALGMRAYARHRRPVVLLLRLLFCCHPLAMGANMVPVLPDKRAPWHALGRLFLVARGFALLVPPFCFLLPPLPFLALQAACAVNAMIRIRADCGCCFLQLAHARAEMEQAARWLATCASVAPTPLPPVELPERFNACLLLARWLQFCWLLVFPCVLAVCGGLAARREFALSLPRGALPRAELSWWAALPVPPLWQVVLLLMPAFSLAVFRVVAQFPLLFT